MSEFSAVTLRKKSLSFSNLAQTQRIWWKEWKNTSLNLYRPWTSESQKQWTKICTWLSSSKNPWCTEFSITIWTKKSQRSLQKLESTQKIVKTSNWRKKKKRKFKCKRLSSKRKKARLSPNITFIRPLLLKKCKIVEISPTRNELENKVYRT